MSKSSKVSEIMLSNILKKCQYLAGEMKFIRIISLRDGIMGPTLPLFQPHLLKSLNNRDAQDLTHLEALHASCTEADTDCTEGEGFAYC